MTPPTLAVNSGRGRYLETTPTTTKTTEDIMTIKGVMLLVFAALYFIAPDLIPGPVDDLFVMALAGVGAIADGKKVAR